MTSPCVVVFSTDIILTAAMKLLVRGLKWEARQVYSLKWLALQGFVFLVDLEVLSSTGEINGRTSNHNGEVNTLVAVVA